MLTFDINKKLGDGSFSNVYSGLLDDQPVAVKRIDLSRSPEAFEREVKIHKTLDHSNIVRLFAIEQDNQILYLAIELMEQGDLYDLLYVHKIPLDSSAWINVTRDLVSGVNYLHQQGLLHLDIKPENILFNTNMQAKIADFGFVAHENDPKRSRFIGTYDYCSPEHAVLILNNAKEYYLHRSYDIYALGITLLEMILCRYPYMMTKQSLSWYVPLGGMNLPDIAAGNLYEIPEKTPQLLSYVIWSCLVKIPGDRISIECIIQLLSILMPDLGFTIPIAAPSESHVIHFAACKGWLDIIKTLIEGNPELVHLRDHLNQTPLLWAASRGNDDIVEFLIERGADVNIPTELPLNLAQRKDHNSSPLDWAFKGAHAKTASILMKAGAIANHLKPEILFEMMYRGELESVEHLIKHNQAFLNQTLGHGETMLHMAVRAIQIDIVRFLINAGADVNKISYATYDKQKGINNSGNTPLDTATQQDDLIALLLIDAGAKIPSAVDNKLHAIHVAARNNRFDLMEIMIDGNQELVHLRDCYNQTPLLWAASRGYDDIVTFLIDKGADVNLATKSTFDSNDYINHNNSPLDWAIKGRHISTASILKKAGAITNNQITENRYLLFNHSQQFDKVTRNYKQSSFTYS